MRKRTIKKKRKSEWGRDGERVNERERKAVRGWKRERE
jgi:hypothetical protein